MLWFTKKKHKHNLKIINEVIEISHNTVTSIMNDIEKVFPNYNFNKDENWEKNLFLSCIGTTLLNNPEAFAGERINIGLNVLSNRLTQDGFNYVCEYIKHFSYISLKFNLDENLDQHICAWLYMNIRNGAELVLEESQPFVFSATIILKTFSGILDENNLVMK
jgi:hypothetical protein